MNEALKPYLKRSLALHGAVLAAAVLLLSRARRGPDQVYMISFVGGPTTLVSAGPAASAKGRPAPAAPAKVPRQADQDAFRTRRNRRAP
ncbi:MAG: hypothetical protein KGM24_09350, partial [Elusimicrobia bacterium]|nr:hypothetical protein [Elusimicrobiota bacterium]